MHGGEPACHWVEMLRTAALGRCEQSLCSLSLSTLLSDLLIRIRSLLVKKKKKNVIQGTRAEKNLLACEQESKHRTAFV